MVNSSEKSPGDKISWAELRQIMEKNGFDSEMIEIVLFVIGEETFNDSSGVTIPGVARGYAGLGQFNISTWNSVSGLPYSEATKVLPSLRAISALAKANQRYHERHFPGIGYFKEIAYLYHNQGAPSAKSFLLSKELTYPSQSASAREVFRQIATEV